MTNSNLRQDIHTMVDQLDEASLQIVQSILQNVLEKGAFQNKVIFKKIGHQKLGNAPTEVEDETFLIVEQMPRFPGCEDSNQTEHEKKLCADKKMLDFIYENLNYPNQARENQIEGTVVIQFVISKDGTIKNPVITKDIGGGCGEEAIRIVESMNNMRVKWTPGFQRGRAVNVQFNLPIRFKLA